MFTGIVQSTGLVKSIETGDNFKHFSIEVDLALIDGLNKGASVANNGVCLTAVKFFPVNENRAVIEFDVIDETLRLSNLDHLTEQSYVNIERSMKAGDEIGGHLVSGHVHSCATLINRIDSTDNCQLNFIIDAKWKKYLFAKGFIAVNGASLTLGDVINTENGCQFTLHLIPETLQRTNLGTLNVGQRVNIEIDQQTMTIVDSIERIMADRLNA